MSLRVLIVPRWGATPSDDWYPWMEAELAASSTFGPVVVGAMPAPEEPTIEAWTSRLTELAGEDPVTLAHTVLLGHSVGCQAILHYLDRLPTSCRVKGTMLVAGWWWVDEPWESIEPWLRARLDLDGIRERAGRVGVLLSDDDPFTSDVVANREQWEQRLGATVEVVGSAAHFNHPEEPRVLSALERWYAA